MIDGRFGNNKELFFEIQFVTANDENFFVEALFDTGFTDGWLAIDSQDLEALGWSARILEIEMQTAQGVAKFDIYSGKIIIDGVEVMIPVHVGKNLPDTIMGSFWLDIMRLVSDKPEGILTLEIVSP
ncbi:aspartyl protease [Scytonema sp. UIC 10036]|uniref:aspartyl protease n=1 Tax=Scytonema sp. UIC 10036 TaxID=2304196 RepID=UPI0012DA6190|nr:aspartyl protease [Scytonema sp. UIC 10036]MUH00230.1 aspartyl protease [Scytonema sp. UIC 10036]